MKIRIALTLFIFCCLFGNLVKAQQPTTAAAYPFIASSKTFTYLTGATPTSSLTGGGGDDGYINNIPIGFTFTFCGANYTTVTASTNGWLALGNTTSTQYTNSSSNIFGPMVMGMWDDLDFYTSSTNTAYGGQVSYMTIGNPGGRIFICQFKEVEPLSSNSKTLTFQVLLYENGVIEIIYKQEATATTFGSATIGIARSSSDYQTLNNSTSTPTSSATFTDFITARPATGQSYLWGITSKGFNNASVNSLSTPGYPFCPGTYNVSVKVKNAGKNQINNVKIYWELDGVLQPVVNYTGLIDTFGSVAGNLVTVPIGPVNFSGPDRNIKFYTSVPNNIADTVNVDDTLNINLGASPKVKVTPSGPTVFCTAGAINVTLNAPPGAGNLYQWLRDNQPIPGATNANYTATLAGDYTVRIDSNGCTNTSAIMRVDNLAMPLPIVHPSGYPVLCSGDSLTLTANAGVTGASYQWQFQGADILGATNASYAVTSPGNYTVITSKFVCKSSSPGINVVPAQQPIPLIEEEPNGTLKTSTTFVSYQWQLDGVDIPGATFFAYKPTKAGSYTVIVSNGGCSGTSDAKLVSTVNINDINTAGYNIKVYPNPAKDVLFIDAPDGTSIAVNSVDGKTVIHQKTSNNPVDVSKLTDGIYIIKLTNTAAELIKIEKLVIAH